MNEREMKPNTETGITKNKKLRACICVEEYSVGYFIEIGNAATVYVSQKEYEERVDRKIPRFISKEGVALEHINAGDAVAFADKDMFFYEELK